MKAHWSRSMLRRISYVPLKSGLIYRIQSITKCLRNITTFSVNISHIHPLFVCVKSFKDLPSVGIQFVRYCTIEILQHDCERGSSICDCSVVVLWGNATDFSFAVSFFTCSTKPGHLGISSQTDKHLQLNNSVGVL